MEQSALANNGTKLGLLRGAGTRMVLWFYAMFRSHRMRAVLLATIHAAKFSELNLTDYAVLSV